MVFGTVLYEPEHTETTAESFESAKLIRPGTKMQNDLSGERLAREWATHDNDEAILLP
jgi:hypothetical protein